jgi:hypothetical protein
MPKVSESSRDEISVVFQFEIRARRRRFCRRGSSAVRAIASAYMADFPDLLPTETELLG